MSFRVEKLANVTDLVNDVRKRRYTGKMKVHMMGRHDESKRQEAHTMSLNLGVPGLEESGVMIVIGEEMKGSLRDLR